VSDLPLVPTAAYEQGLSAHVASGIRNERGLLTGIKSTSYMESIVALRDARHAGFDDAIFLDTHGFISEATASNVFAIIDDVVVTPAVTHGILPGITRAVVLELAQQLKIPAVERELSYQELVNASEAFLTSSLRGIVPLVRVNEMTIGRGTPDTMTHRIMTAYANQTPRI
jgi:branched-subunit amino acid aminotransferase/4-amino-4-deoxychorismate lyase